MCLAACLICDVAPTSFPLASVTPIANTWKASRSPGTKHLPIHPRSWIVRPTCPESDGSNAISSGRPGWMDVPMPSGCHWPESHWSGSSGPRFRPQKFETYPMWGANPVRCFPAILFCFFSLPVRMRVRAQSGLELLAAFVAVPANELYSPSKSERGRISHFPANPIQSTGAEFHRHEGLGRERAFWRPRLPAGEAKARIVIGMAENDGDVFTPLSQQIEAMPDEPSTDALSLMFW